MDRVAFYFDPLCPWCWITSVWMREVQTQRQIDVEWKFFSLAEVNELDEVRYGPLRVCALARREGGNDAVARAYVALGGLIHEGGIRITSQDVLEREGPPALEAEGLDGSLVHRALQDESTLEDVKVEHRDAVERYEAFGVPWLVLDGQEKGFFGPVVGELLEGARALELWDHTLWVLAQPYLYEFKRGRQPLPALRKDREAATAAR